MKRNLLKKALGLVLGLSVIALAPAAYAEYNPKLLRIGFQKSASLLTLLKAEGTLEKKLAPLGIEVKWVEFPAGPQLLEGLNVGAIDFGYVGEAPPIFAQAAGANFVYVGHEDPAPRAEALIVPKDSPIKSVADLKGKKIALNKGSNVHYLLVKLLEKHGLKYADVQTVFIPPADARAAFERGSVDAWVIWDPFTAAAQQQIGARIIADGTGVVNNYAFFLAEREFATKRPEVIKEVFGVLQQTGQTINQNPKAAAARIAPLQGLDPGVVEQTVRNYTNVVKPISPPVIEAQQKVADTFFDLKLIPKAIQVKDATVGLK
ncbi:sulfonate ABC transporter substrate-binding protein [Accumulibacter sp.]|uniref:sulfonate ABC transporter substrate-binding protein n=1 Tax=Accumulibacter sp. TaxID=2053492 RepID=UPI002600F6E1|nr:sulfonate ABC transporter substrate-binding protein [Accumulibacter sp.]MCM8595516.1 sulfonate ABC transporter substrate-binding protein [Accumulibacter sp.]MCM8626827.1 sulfonate ABC transporter substrate-binding protein [Accumulibacter sp.]MDS4049663.1 sulfonate ABC transporter substrate-binding protein [Accumulibacter sp.]